MLRIDNSRPAATTTNLIFSDKLLAVPQANHRHAHVRPSPSRKTFLAVESTFPAAESTIVATESTFPVASPASKAPRLAEELRDGVLC